MSQRSIAAPGTALRMVPVLLSFVMVAVRLLGLTGP